MTTPVVNMHQRINVNISIYVIKLIALVKSKSLLVDYIERSTGDSSNAICSIWALPIARHLFTIAVCCYFITVIALCKGGSRRVTSHPLARQPISCYYYACDLSYFDVVNSQTLKFHSPVSPDPLNACLLRSLGFPEAPPVKNSRSANVVCIEMTDENVLLPNIFVVNLHAISSR